MARAREVPEHPGGGRRLSELGLAVGPDHEQPLVAELASDEGEEQERLVVRPVEVVEDDDQQLRPHGGSQEHCHSVKQPESCRLGIQRLLARC